MYPNERDQLYNIFDVSNEKISFHDNKAHAKNDNYLTQLLNSTNPAPRQSYLSPKTHWIWVSYHDLLLCEVFLVINLSYFLFFVSGLSKIGDSNQILVKELIILTHYFSPFIENQKEH